MNCVKKAGKAFLNKALLITRALPQAKDFAVRVASVTGYAPHIAPMQKMVDLDVTPDLTGVAGLAFTSKNAVSSFARLSPRRDLPAYCVGDATARHAAKLGFTSHSATGDARALAAMIAPISGKVLHLHGVHLSAPVSAEHLAIYEQVALNLDRGTLEKLADGGITATVVFSPRSARLLAKAWPKSLEFYCISAAAAEPLLNIGPCKIAAEPSAAALLRLLSADNLGK